LAGGLDVLTAFLDGGVRYINHSSKLAIFEPPLPPQLNAKAEELLRVSHFLSTALDLGSSHAVGRRTA
jgi:hypothetical protein